MPRLGRSLTAAAATCAALLGGAGVAHAAGADTWANWTSAKQEAHIESLDFIGPQLFAGSEGDGVFTSSNALGPWGQINGGLNPQEGDLNIHQVVASGATLYAATTGGLFQGSSGGNWQPLAQGAGPRMLNEAVNTVHVNAPGDLVVGTASRGAFYSSDGGAHWDKATGTPDAESFFHIVSLNGVLYAGASDGIFISANGGRSWTLHSDGIPAQSVFRIGVGVGGGNEMYASTSGGIYKSTNAGLTWNDASGVSSVPGTFLPAGAKRGLFAGGALLGNRFVAGTQSGVWATIDGGDTWGQMSTDTLPNAAQSMGAEIVNTVGIGFSPPALMAGTSARGVYSLALAPVTTGSAPAITPASGITVGEQLTASNGTWNGTLPLFFAYQWKRCDNAGNNCSSIAGGTGKTYTVAQADLNATIRVVVSATNLLSPSAVPQTSTQTTAVTGAPANAPTPPSGFPKIGPTDASYAWGKTFTIDPGSPWKSNGNPIVLSSTTYKWQRCDGNGLNCVDIPGATSPTYTSGKADIGKKLAGYVTGTFSGSPTTSFAGQTLLIIEKKPVNTELPKLVGTSYLGEEASSTAGAWDGNALTYERQWLACEADGLGCTPIINATGQSFTPTAQQAGKRLQVRVTAIADDGIQKRTTDAYSEPGPAVTTRPVVVTPPGTTPPGTTPPGTTPPGTTPPGGTVPLTSKTVIKLTLPKRIKVGATLAAPKKIKGAKSVKYQWLRNGKAIKRATKRTYRIVRADRGKKLQLRLTIVTTAGKKLVLKTKAVKVPRR